jgi:hypothetical protein
VVSLDRRVRILFSTVTLLFIAAVALQIHGSSIALWNTVLNDNSAPSGILFSTPKAVRTDEWLAWTPALLAQAQHNPPFPVENANIGAGKTPLLVNLPARHYAMFFRPQLYGFFLFGLESGYAWYWNVKIFGLLVSFFFLLRLLAPGHFWLPLFGAAWVFFSAYTQWWFSCPPMLPEMLSSWALTIFCTIQLFRAQSPLMRLLLCALLVIGAVNFTLCFYPPFQIPLVYVGLALLTGWFWQNRGSGLRWRPGVWSIAATTIAIAAVLIPFVLECKPTLEIVASTSYPGARRSHGGDLNVVDTFNGLLGFFNWSEDQFLAMGKRGNPSESSNFYPLWVLSAASAGSRLWRERGKSRIELALLSALVVLALYTFCHFPDPICRWTGLNFVTGNRALLAIGVAGIVFTIMVMAQRREPHRKIPAIVLAFLGVAAVVAMLLSYDPGSDPFLTPWRCALFVGLNAIFIGLYLFAPLKIFCTTFILCLVLNNGLVNPVATGLGPLLDSDAAALVRAVKHTDPAAKWIVYSRSSLAQFLKAQGIDVINGLQYVPDLALWHDFDPAGRYANIYNRYAFSTFELAAGTRTFSLLGNVAYAVDVVPSDPALATRGVRFAAFPNEVTDADTRGLKFVSSAPGGRLWIYRLARPQ